MIEVTKYCQDVLAILDAAAVSEQRVTSAKLLDAWFGRGATSLKVSSSFTSCFFLNVFNQWIKIKCTIVFIYGQCFMRGLELSRLILLKLL